MSLFDEKAFASESFHVTIKSFLKAFDNSNARRSNNNNCPPRLRTETTKLMIVYPFIMSRSLMHYFHLY